ncbi:helix-turn-helix domain-containing protein [Amycolatopsis plumensis]|uniref:helix-turn-helix domain-containing protein n=1 Tax=Amycolatopsis plumensis TaxID=236508 RepID=UPI00360F5ACA
MRTLRIFLTADRSFASTAEELFIHRNTLRYRLRRSKSCWAMRSPPLDRSAIYGWC